MIAALYVEKNGVYFGLPDVDPWDETRDARRYEGPHPVVAHPPCQRWGRYWSGGPMLANTPSAKKKGDDGGCFEAALKAVRDYGGVLEHPQASHAWKHFGIPKPPFKGGWVSAPMDCACCEAWTCCVEQGHCGHRARKATWLYYVGPRPPDLIWGPSKATIRIDPGFHSKEERRRAIRTGACQLLGHRERAATPIPFRDLLLDLARGAR